MPSPTAAYFTSFTGQYLIDLTNDLLAGYSNGVDSRALLSYLNMGKDALWETIKELHDEYFQVFSQNTNANAPYYFPALNTTTRDYTLPEDLRSIEFIECPTLQIGGTSATFTYAKLNSPTFREARRTSNELGGPDPNSTGQHYIYSIAGHDQFVLASYPSQPYPIVLWYTAAIPDFEPGDTISDFVFPFVKKIAEYAAKKAMLGMQDAGQFAMWEREWRNSLTNTLQASAERNDADPIFAEDFMGGME
jgi:hypothetical protein